MIKGMLLCKGTKRALRQPQAIAKRFGGKENSLVVMSRVTIFSRDFCMCANIHVCMNVCMFTSRDPIQNKIKAPRNRFPSLL